jgi:pimeloyl-ACP methyl ester carboxylesterase
MRASPFVRKPYSGAVKPLRTALVTALVVVVIVVIAVPGLLWLVQDRLIFFPQPIASAAHLPPRTQPLTVTAGDGTKLHGFLVPADRSPAPAAIYFGGNAEEVSWTIAAERWPRGYTRIALNYRGYGTSEGKPSAQALLADGLAIYDAVAARGDVDPSRIAVFGRSLGTAVATHVAANRPVARTILVSPYDSLAAVGSRHYPLLPVSLMLRHRFMPLADAAHCHSPLLAIVAPGDAVIPVTHSRALFDAWAGAKTWREVAGADHNTLGATREYWDAIADFLAA